MKESFSSTEETDSCPRLPSFSSSSKLSLALHKQLAKSKSPRDQAALRSEEHTSELQSHLNLVCRLLLEKKKSNMKKYILTAYHNSNGDYEHALAIKHNALGRLAGKNLESEFRCPLHRCRLLARIRLSGH